MPKRIIVISVLHFIVFTVALITSVTIEADVMRNGGESLPIGGHFLKVVAQILSQPTQSVALKFIAKDSYLFWPLMIFNSAIWGIIISLLLDKMRSKGLKARGHS